MTVPHSSVCAQAYFIRMAVRRGRGLQDFSTRIWIALRFCALGEEEDPVQGTVRGVDGGFYQPENDPNGAWDGACSPARYADFMEFGIYMNRKFYQIRFICSLIFTSYPFPDGR